jgi:hypothetical protein
MLAPPHTASFRANGYLRKVALSVKMIIPIWVYTGGPTLIDASLIEADLKRSPKDEGEIAERDPESPRPVQRPLRPLG